MEQTSEISCDWCALTPEEWEWHNETPLVLKPFHGMNLCPECLDFELWQQAEDAKNGTATIWADEQPDLLQVMVETAHEKALNARKGGKAIKRLIVLILLVLLAGWSPDSARAQETPPPRGILIIPSIDLVRYIQIAPVIEVDGLRVHDVAWLGDGVAWLDDTGWVDTPHWRLALAGHNPGAFVRLGELQPGDSIYLITDAGLVRYVAAEVYVVDPTETWVLDSTGEPSLVLITCSGVQRLAVVAWR